MSAKKKYLTNDFIPFIHRVRQILSPCTNHCPNSIFTISVFIYLAVIPNIPILFTAIPQHIISFIHCIGHTALITTLHSHIWWDELPRCYDPQWLNVTLKTYLNPQRFTISLTNSVNGIRILNMCVLYFCVVSVVWSVSSNFFFLFVDWSWFIVLQLTFNFSMAISLLPPLD